MRRIPVLLAFLLLLPAAAQAKDVTDADLPAAVFPAADLVPTAQTKLPKGWALRPESPAAAARSKAFTAAVQKALGGEGAEASPTEVLTCELAGPAAAAATVGVVRAPRVEGQAPPDLPQRLGEAAKASGWALRTAGSPACVLVVAGPEGARNELLVAASRWAAEVLTPRAQAVLETNDPFGALALLHVALALEPRCVHAHALARLVRQGLAMYKREHGSYARSVQHGAEALATYEPYPLTREERATQVGAYGLVLLLVGGQDEKAYEVLTKAVADPDVQKSEGFWNCRYNLACAAVRLKKGDQAFAELSAILAENAKKEIFGIDAWRDDADFLPLHPDPRWKALLEKYPEER